MAKQLYLLLRKNTYYFRRRVPDDLRSCYPSADICESLHTQNAKEAAGLARQLAVKLDADFKDHRQRLFEREQLKARLLGEPKEIVLSEKTIADICNSYRLDVLLGNDTSREFRHAHSEGLSFEEEHAQLKSFCASLREQNRKADYSETTRELLAFLQRERYAVDESCLEMFTLRRKFMETMIKVCDILLQRFEGDVVETETFFPDHAIPTLAPYLRGVVTSSAASPPQPAAQEHDPSFDEVFDNWRKTGHEKAPSSVKGYQEAWNSFRAYANVSAPSKLTRSMLNSYRDQLKDKDELASATIVKKLQMVATILRFAVDEQLLKENPAVRMRLKSNMTDDLRKRVPFRPENLKAIFSSPVFTDRARPNAGGGEAAFWVPVLGFFTGARLEELCQLHCSDVMQDAKHGWHIRIQQGQGKRLKSPSSRRDIPLRQEVLALGFLEYLKVAQERGDRLFPDLVLAASGNWSANFSKWFGRYFEDKLWAPEKNRQVFHSFRHGFKHYMRESFVLDEISDQLSGHSKQTVSKKYGEEWPPLGPLVAAMQQCEFPAIDIPPWRPA